MKKLCLLKNLLNPTSVYIITSKDGPSSWRSDNNKLKKHLLRVHTKYKISQKSITDKHIQKINSFNPSKDLNVFQNIIVDTSDELCVFKLFDDKTFDTFKNIKDAVIRFVLKMYNISALPRNIVQIVIEDLKYLKLLLLI